MQYNTYDNNHDFTTVTIDFIQIHGYFQIHGYVLVK